MQLSTSKRIVFTTWGSFDDLHPFMALALELKARGHRPAIASIAEYRPKVEAADIDFVSLPPWLQLPDTEEGQEVMRRMMHLCDAPRYVIQEMLAPAELMDCPREGVSNNGNSKRSKLPLLQFPSRSGPLAAPAAAVGTAKRERRPIISRSNPWRWEFGSDGSVEA